MQKLLIGLVTGMAAIIGYLGHTVHRLENTGVTYAQSPPQSFEQCAGAELASYMNTVIDGVGNPANVRLLSPIFNLTSPVDPAIFDTMAANGASFAALDGFAGNTYNTADGTLAVDHYERGGWPAKFSGRPVHFTEFGDFDRNFGRLSNEYARATSATASISLFNALETNPDERWSDFVLTREQITQVTAADPEKGGANSGMPVVGPGFASDVASYGLNWTVEIVNGPGDLESAKSMVNNAPGNITPILRLCTNNETHSCGFSDPQSLIGFINTLDAEISREVYVTIGPNEPATELWALSPECQALAPEQPPAAQGDQPLLPCTAEGTEFHSLRPYPGQPCNPNIQNATLLCGNDLITREVFRVTPEDALECRTEVTSNVFTIISCDFEIESSIDYTIDLSDAELPIAGNTEDVPHNPDSSAIPSKDRKENPENPLGDALRVNEYVSWYLNGTLNRAEETFVKDSDRIINFSGPLNKLLPFFIQGQERNGQAQDGDTTQVRHNQIVGCTVGQSVSIGGRDLRFNSGQIIPCYDQTIGGLLGNLPFDTGIPTLRNRLADWTPGGRDGEDHLRPKEEVKGNLIDIIIARKKWRGRECLEQRIAGFDLFYCVSFDPIGELDFWGDMFPYIPYTSTEDRVGFVVANQAPSQPTAGEGNEVELLSVEHTFEDPKNKFDLLYFAHAQENVELADLAQDTFVAQSTERVGSIEQPAIPARCEFLNSRTNDGDDLLGEINQENGPEQASTIAGTITYTSRFTREFRRVITPDGIVFDPPSHAVNARTATALSLAAPEAGTLWNRLVGGPQSLFKRVFPKIGAGAPVSELEQIPAKIRGAYQALRNESTSIASVGSPQAFAGVSRPGRDAELFVPYLGGVDQYFLEDVQTALRPQGFGSTGPSSIDLPSPGPVAGICELGNGLCGVDNLSDFGEQAQNASQICHIESGGGNELALNNSCTFSTDGIDNDGDGLVDSEDDDLDKATVDYSVGLFQINLLSHDVDELNCTSAFSSFTFDPPTCTIVDQELLDECVARLQNPEKNIQRALEVSNIGQDWSPWAAAGVCGIN